MLVSDIDEMGFPSHRTLLDFLPESYAEVMSAANRRYVPDTGLSVPLFQSLPCFPALAMLDDFNDKPPAKILKLPPRISPAKDEERDLLEFFKQIPRQKVTWQVDAKKKVLHFGPYYRRIFKRIAYILYSYHKNNFFSGDIIGRMRIDSNGHITHPYQPVNNSKFDLKGREVDIIHFRWLVAKAVKIYFGKDYEWHLSKYFKLCFSELFLHPAGLKSYYMFQYYHPVFYNDDDKYKLVHVLYDLWKRDETYFGGHFGLDAYVYGYHRWWSLLAKEKAESMLGGVYLYRNNKRKLYDNEPNSLPIFLRNCHHHYTDGTKRKNKKTKDQNQKIRAENKEIQMNNNELRKMWKPDQFADLQLQPPFIPEKQETPLDPMPYHSELEPKITERFPGIYACMVDSCIRGFHDDGKEIFGCTLAQLRFEEGPFGFEESVD